MINDIMVNEIQFAKITYTVHWNNAYSDCSFTKKTLYQKPECGFSFKLYSRICSDSYLFFNFQNRFKEQKINWKNIEMNH